MIRVLVLIVLAGFAAVSVAQHEGHVPKPAQPADRSASSPVAESPAIPRPTDADRAAAFPDLGGMSAQAHMAAGPRWRVLADRLEWQDADEGDALAWDLEGWFGGDFDRLGCAPRASASRAIRAARIFSSFTGTRTRAGGSWSRVCVTTLVQDRRATGWRSAYRGSRHT